VCIVTRPNQRDGDWLNWGPRNVGQTTAYINGGPADGPILWSMGQDILGWRFCGCANASDPRTMRAVRVLSCFFSPPKKRMILIGDTSLYTLSRDCFGADFSLCILAVGVLVPALELKRTAVIVSRLSSNERPTLRPRVSSRVRIRLRASSLHP
jgi:hypothetical protein